jgi:hypothetical protein
MSQEFGWWDRDEDGRKYQVKAAVFGGKLSWTCQRARFEPWETYEPLEQDWETLEELARNRFQRALVRQECLDVIALAATEARKDPGD